jgi:DNA-binding CsgD family transcriptional regulator
MRDDDEILNLIGAMYDAALEPSRWPGLLERLSDRLGHAAVALVTSQDFEQPVDVWLARYDPVCVVTRFQQYPRPNVNPGIRACMAASPWQVIARRQFIADREFERDPAAQAILLRQGLYHGRLATLFRAGPLLSTLMVYRPKHLNDFSKSETRLLQLMMPHLARALEVHRHASATELHRRQAEEALNQLDEGFMILSADGRVMFANRTAEQVLHRRDGIMLQSGKLAACLPASDGPLQRLIGRAGGRASDRASARIGGALRINRGPGRRPLQVLTVPLPRDPQSLLLSSPQSDVLLLLIDPEQRRPPPREAFKALHGLTDAEARLACGLLEGDRLEDYADRAGISLNTARTHLKAIFAKTDTNRQATLVRLLSRTLSDRESAELTDLTRTGDAPIPRTR